jgi:phytoene dehydrogenase-like protein
MATSYDAVVIGAGINGLAVAAMLARGGERVLVVERGDAPGGSAATHELAPGFRVDGCACDVGWIDPLLDRALELGRHGLRVLRSEATVFTPLPDGDSLTLWRDARRTSEELARHSEADARRWGAFSERMAHIAGFLRSLYVEQAPTPSAGSVAELLALVKVGRRLRGLGRREMTELLRVLPMSVQELLDDWFESDALKATLGASGITSLLQGPRSGGTAFLMLHHHVGNEPGVFRARTAVQGGPAGLASALWSAARERGVEIRCCSDVTRITVEDGRATGVLLDGGTEVRSRRVVSSADPRRTMLELADPQHLQPDFVRAVRNIKYRGVSALVHLALGELPRFAARGANGDGEALRGVISISPSLEHLERAYDDAKYGGISRRPYLEATIPSLLDPSLAPSGRHVMSVRVQYAPYRLRDGAWDDARRESLGDLVMQTLAEYAPNLRDIVLHRDVLTPADIERRYALTEGQPDHGQLTLDQILFMRPVPGHARYRTPIDGLYLCGSGSHPGGRVAGGAGRLAAKAILQESR